MVIATCALSALLAVQASFAQQPDNAPTGVTDPSIATSLPANSDPDGRRRKLAERGVVYSLMYTNDLLANVDGGLKRGLVDQGKVEGTLAIDLEKLAGLKGISFYANGFQIHNTGRIRRDYVGGINTIAAIEAVPAIRLSELWVERQLLDGKASLRIGQLAADVEFFFSGASALFLQSDWATITALNLPSGGPAYPLSTPGARFKYDPNANLTLLLAVFNGDPAGPGEGDEQLRNRHGLNFRVRDPALVMAEAQFKRNTGAKDAGLATTFKAGAWAHFGKFEHQRLADDGTFLANSAGSGNPLTRRGNNGVYAVLDQQIYRPAGGAADSGVTVFGRVSASPSDRNVINSYFDVGMVATGMVPRRPDDKFGVSFMHAQYSDQLRAFDRDVIAVTGAGKVRDFEANLEFTYSAQIVPGWTFQPVATYVWHPSGTGKDATVVGARTFLRY